MDILAQHTANDLDVSSTEQLVFTYTADKTMVVIAQLSLLGLVGGSYGIHFYVDGVVTVPDQSVPIATTNGIAQSRSMLVKEDSTITITVLGVAGDTAITVETLLVDASPVAASEVISIIQPDLEEIVNDAIVNARPMTMKLGVVKPKKRCNPKKPCP